MNSQRAFLPRLRGDEAMEVDASVFFSFQDLRPLLFAVNFEFPEISTTGADAMSVVARKREKQRKTERDNNRASIKRAVVSAVAAPRSLFLSRMDALGIDPSTCRMRSDRSTI